jgi:hypothetical protein
LQEELWDLALIGWSVILDYYARDLVEVFVFDWMRWLMPDADSRVVVQGGNRSKERERAQEKYRCGA